MCYVVSKRNKIFMEVVSMHNYLETFRLKELSFSRRKIIDMAGLDQSVIKSTIDIVKQKKIIFKELSVQNAVRIDIFPPQEVKVQSVGYYGFHLVFYGYVKWLYDYFDTYCNFAKTPILVCCFLIFSDISFHIVYEETRV